MGPSPCLARLTSMSRLETADTRGFPNKGLKIQNKCKDSNPGNEQNSRTKWKGLYSIGIEILLKIPTNGLCDYVNYISK